MTIGSFITITNPIKRQDPFSECLNSALHFSDKVFIVDGGSTDSTLEGIQKNPRIEIVQHKWPEEYSFGIYGKAFQLGYDALDTDWVIKLDADYIIHENDKNPMYLAFMRYDHLPALSFYKCQFLLVDRYTVKTRLPIAFNKKKFSNRIKFDSGGDKAQASFDGVYMQDIQEANIPFYNYDWSFKTKDFIAKEFHRYAKAWYREFGEDPFGKESEEEALKRFIDMQVKRFNWREHKKIKLEEHPMFIQETIKKMNPDQFGYSMWGTVETASYFNV